MSIGYYTVDIELDASNDPKKFIDLCVDEVEFFSSVFQNYAIHR